MVMEVPVVLLVDDSKTDAMLMRVVFERGGFAQPLRCAIDGEDAIAYLQGDGRYSDRTQYPLPTLVLMDLHMPRKNGFETLKWIRRQPAFRRLHVYILSGSSQPEDIELAYDLGANSYLIKPSNLDGLVQFARSLELWLRHIHIVPLNGGARGHERVASGAASPDAAGLQGTPER
jgi:CheY-like chemotaxis protein